MGMEGSMCPFVLSAVRPQLVQTSAGCVHAATVWMCSFVHPPCCYRRSGPGSSPSSLALTLFSAPSI